MRKTLKLRCSGFSIVLLLVAVLGATGIEDVTENNIENYLERDCESVSDFIKDNLSTFADKYNEATEEEWKVSFVEDRKSVIDIDSEEKYIYLDFNDDNGYAIVGNDYNFLDFSTTGDLSYTKTVDVLYWSSYDGFVYNENGEYLRYDTSYLTEDDLNEYTFKYDGKAASKYAGGSDVINNIPEYLKSRYGGAWYYDSKGSKSLINYTDVYQNDYAIYDNSEGNCTLSAYFGIFQYLRDNKNFKNLPTGNVIVDTSGDSFSDGHTVTNTSVPEIYAKIRENAMNYDYTVESNWWTSTTMARWGNESLASMGYKSDWNKAYIYMYLTWTFNNQVVKNINAGYPVMWNQARENYKNHSMVVKGYKTYKKDHKIWFIRWSESKHFMEMNDNWRSTGATTYIDFDGYAFDLIHEGFGTFVVVKDYKW